MIASMLALILSLVPVSVVPQSANSDTQENLEKAHERAPKKMSKKAPKIRRSRTSTQTSRSTQKPEAPKVEKAPQTNTAEPKSKRTSEKRAPTPAPKTETGADAAQPQLSNGDDRVIDGVHAFYKDAQDLRASFTQKYTYTVYGRTQVSNGRVFFKKPGMMRWDYQKPTPKVFVADGKELWVYEPEENQAFRRKLGSSQLPVALAFMAGTGDLRQEFKITVKTDNPSHFTLELIPKLNEGDYKKVILTVDRSSYAVKTSTVVDAVGNVNRVEFAGMKTNVGLKDRGFNFTPPAGVRVIKD